MDGPQVAPWAEWGALEPLTNRMQEAGIAAEDYYTPCWLQTNYGKDVWALTFCADPNFAFVWNRALFREVGLDPDRPPRTMDELDEYAAKLTKTDMPGEPFFPERIFHYNCVHLRVVEKPAFVLDISEFWVRKLAAIQCFESQFISGRSTEPPTILDRLRDQAAYWGWSIGARYGEPFMCRETVGVRSFRDVM